MEFSKDGVNDVICSKCKSEMKKESVYFCAGYGSGATYECKNCGHRDEEWHEYVETGDTYYSPSDAKECDGCKTLKCAGCKNQKPWGVMLSSIKCEDRVFEKGRYYCKVWYDIFNEKEGCSIRRCSKITDKNGDVIKWKG